MSLLLEKFLSDTERAAFVHRAVGVFVVLLCVFAAWVLLSRWAARVKAHIAALHASALEASSADPEESAAEIDDARRRLTALKLVTNAARYLLWGAVLLAGLRLLDVPLEGLLLPAGFLGAALGLGAQNLVRDIVSGLFLVFEGQFAVGDVVTINDKTGTVSEIGLRVTRIRDESGTTFLFPNGAITSVAKYARRETVLAVSIPLASTDDRAAIAATARAAIENFGGSYDALQGSIEEGPANEHRLVFLLPLRPVRAALVRDKLPARLTAALEQASLPLPSGTEIGVYAAS
jgi:small-conductance mechanosensitive channel